MDGTQAVYLSAGITGIETSIIQAALVDGASGRQLARHITFPLLRPVFAYIVITAAAGSLLIFQVPLTRTSRNQTGSELRRTQ
jgi:cellobiose transport system permease protein